MPCLRAVKEVMLLTSLALMYWFGCSDAVTSVSHGGVLANEFFAAYHDVCGM